MFQSSYYLEKNNPSEANAEISINDVIDKSPCSEWEEEEEPKELYLVATNESSKICKKKARNVAWHKFIEKKKTLDPHYVDTRRARERERLRKKRERTKRISSLGVEDVSKDLVTSIRSLTHDELNFAMPETTDFSSQARKLDIQEQLCNTEERIRNLNQLIWENMRSIFDDNERETLYSPFTLEPVRKAAFILESAEREVHWLSKQLEDFTAAVDNLSQVVEAASEKVESFLLLHAKPSHSHPLWS